ncbi:hypothetical protein J7J81_01285 [bacterium]|nr:hypothetical protein [bacterium]
MFREKLSKFLPYLAIVPANPHPPVIGIKYFDLNTLMGQSLGWLKWPILFSLCFAAVTFVVATFYIIRYTRGYYEKRAVSKSWKCILAGFFITAIAETGELLCYYEWPNAGLIESNFILAIPHALGGFLIGLGAYLLYKEVTP